MSKDSEYNRGKRWAKKYFSKFRSFKKDSSGRIIGYKLNGSTEVIGKPDRGKYTGFTAGANDEQKRIIKSKPVRKSTTKRTGFGFSTPKFPRTFRF